jgi:excisionase family DNA binding protein
MDEIPNQRQLTISVPEAGRRLGIGRNTAYEAARQGQLPTLRIGKRLVVPIVAFEQMLAVQSKSQIVAAELMRRLQREGADEQAA